MCATDKSFLVYPLHVSNTAGSPFPLGPKGGDLTDGKYFTLNFLEGNFQEVHSKYIGNVNIS